MINVAIILSLKLKRERAEQCSAVHVMPSRYESVVICIFGIEVIQK